MIYEQIYRLALYTVVAPDIRNQWMSETVAAAGRQIVQTERFAKLCETLQEHGIRYVVLKGISWQNLVSQVRVAAFWRRRYIDRSWRFAKSG